MGTFFFLSQEREIPRGWELQMLCVCVGHRIMCVLGCVCGCLRICVYWPLCRLHTIVDEVGSVHVVLSACLRVPHR
jgi:hypothetical protein